MRCRFRNIPWLWATLVPHTTPGRWFRVLPCLPLHFVRILPVHVPHCLHYTALPAAARVSHTCYVLAVRLLPRVYRFCIRAFTCLLPLLPRALPPVVYSGHLPTLVGHLQFCTFAALPVGIYATPAPFAAALLHLPPTPTAPTPLAGPLQPLTAFHCPTHVAIRDFDFTPFYPRWLPAHSSAAFTTYSLPFHCCSRSTILLPLCAPRAYIATCLPTPWFIYLGSWNIHCLCYHTLLFPTHTFPMTFLGFIVRFTFIYLLVDTFVVHCIVCITIVNPMPYPLYIHCTFVPLYYLVHITFTHCHSPHIHITHTHTHTLALPHCHLLHLLPSHTFVLHTLL